MKSLQTKSPRYEQERPRPTPCPKPRWPDETTVFLLLKEGKKLRKYVAKRIDKLWMRTNAMRGRTSDESS